jgi:hypothetical protein
VSVLEVATRFAPKFLSSHILPVLGKRTVFVKNDWVNHEKVLIAKFVNSRIGAKFNVRCVKD